LEILSNHYHPCSLGQLLEYLQRREIPPGLVAVTFDDGYADNLYNAKPLLESFNIPASVFVSAGYMDSGQEFWWDALERVLLNPGTLPTIVHIIGNTINLRMEMGGAANYSEHEYEFHRNWNVLEKSTPTTRHHYYKQLHSLLLPLSHQDRRAVIVQLLDSSCKQDKARDSHRPLTPSELKELAQGMLVEVGGHTVNHCLLSAISKDDQIAEINFGKTRLEEVLGVPVTHFSYPYGTTDSYTQETIEEVRRAGYLSACANFSGSVTKSSSQWELPRRLVRNYDGEIFERQIRNWFLD
jgi:peptidoglycan/xylan/chitin deacetylase (PgdA/CDA1 family)